MGPDAGAEPIEAAAPSGAAIRVKVLNALSEYRAAETAMLRRTRSLGGRGATDALALRYLQDAARTGGGLRPTELAHRLGVSSATITALMDRLVDSGAAIREPHPADRRAFILRCTEQNGSEALRAVNQAMRPVDDVVESLTATELATVLDFLQQMRTAVEAVARS